jgi:hypothetical protein
LEIFWSLSSDSCIHPLGERNDCHSRQHVKILRKRISAG